MKRRNFLRNGMAVAASAIPLSQSMAKNKIQGDSLAEKTFKLNYAPHDGMFSNHAGKNFIDQIKFMHDQGFRGIWHVAEICRRAG
jgi:hydroxypyruvate isomerase